MSSIGLVFGGPSPEHDISILTGLQVEHLLVGAGHDVTSIYWSKAGEWLRVDRGLPAQAFLEPRPAGAVALELTVPGGFVERKRMRQSAIDLEVVVNCCHGGAGEDGSLVALLNLAGLRVTGPNAQASVLAMDKLALAALADSIGVPVIPTRALTPETTTIDLPGPWVVKPRFGGSSLGVEVGVEDLDTARALARSGVSRSGAVVQPYLKGWIDLNIAVRAHPSPEVSLIERPKRADDGIYDYKRKYLAGQDGMESAARELPAEVPAEVAARIADHALRLQAAGGFGGIPRVDFMWDGADDLVLCEVNSIPGAYGLYLWNASGTTRTKALELLVEEALAGLPRPPQWAASSDGAALRVAGGVASKLA